MDHELAAIPVREIIKGFHGKLIHTDNITLAFWDVEAGAELPLHQHVHEQTTQVMESRFELTVNDVRKIYEPGTVVVIPSQMPHKGLALTACKLLDTFTPAREDYK